MAIQEKTVSTGDYAWKSWSNGYVISLTLKQEQTDIDANTSLVSYLFTISNTDNNRFIANYNSWTISIGGQDIAIDNFNFNLGTNYTTQIIASGQVTVAHNTDGTCHMPYDVSIPNIQSWNQYGPPAMALSGAWELEAIPRTASISCPVGTIGQPVTVSLHKADGGLSHTVTYQFGSLEGTVVERTQQSQIQWTIPKSFYTQIPNARRGSGTLTCETYNGDVLVGQTSCQFYANVDEEACRPVIFAQIEDENDTAISLTGDCNTLIRYQSNARVSATYFGRNSATITDYKMTHNGKVYTDSEVLIEGVENGTFEFTVTDSRGLTTSYTEIKSVIPYVKLTCNLTCDKPDGDGNMTLSLSGNFFDGYFGDADNSLVVQYRYKPVGTTWATSDGWHRIGPAITGNGYFAEEELSGLDYQTAYTFQAQAIDELTAVNSAEYTVRAMPVFDWGERDFSIHGDLQVDGGISVDSDVSAAGDISAGGDVSADGGVCAVGDISAGGNLFVNGSLYVGDTPVLNTPNVQTYYWHTSGSVSMESVEDFLATCTNDCAFITMIRGDAPPYVGMAVGAVYGSGKYGAVTLYDCLHGVQSRRVYDGVFYET